MNRRAEWVPFFLLWGTLTFLGFVAGNRHALANAGDPCKICDCKPCAQVGIATTPQWGFVVADSMTATVHAQLIIKSDAGCLAIPTRNDGTNKVDKWSITGGRNVCAGATGTDFVEYYNATLVSANEYGIQKQKCSQTGSVPPP